MGKTINLDQVIHLTKAGRVNSGCEQLLKKKLLINLGKEDNTGKPATMLRSIIRMKKISSVLAVGLMTLATSVGSAQIVINEFVYDDTSTDDREFVELYNAGNSAVNIGGWSLGGRDNAGVNLFANIPANTFIAAGAYYVIGQTGVQNVNQVVGTMFENDADSNSLSR